MTPNCLHGIVLPWPPLAARMGHLKWLFTAEKVLWTPQLFLSITTSGRDFLYLASEPQLPHNLLSLSGISSCLHCRDAWGTAYIAPITASRCTDSTKCSFWEDIRGNFPVMNSCSWKAVSCSGFFPKAVEKCLIKFPCHFHCQNYLYPLTGRCLTSSCNL